MPRGWAIRQFGCFDWLVVITAELAWTAVNVGLTWICVRRFGVEGAGIAFFGAYVSHGLMVFAIVRRLTGFRWSSENLMTGALFVFSIGAVFVSFHVLPPASATIFGAAAMFASSARCRFGFSPRSCRWTALRRD